MKNIVLTGGPCGGKSTALAEIKECLEQRGYKVFIVEESATKLINKGIKPFGENAISMYDFQKIIMRYQLRQENIARAKAKLYSNSVIIYDRSTIDNKAYLNDISWLRLLKELNLDYQKLMNRYDLVIHLVTVADGKEELYTKANNIARSEGVEEAKLKDVATLSAYLGHNNLKVVDNSTDFKSKINRVKNCILAQLNEPLCLNNQYKFLVNINNSNMDKVKAISVKSYIIQDYLISNDDIDRKVRQKIADGQVSYYLTEKIKNKNKEEIKTNRKISRLEYLYYLKFKDMSLDTVEKVRYSFRDNKEVFNLDVFENSNYAILENETTKNISALILPEFLNIENNNDVCLNNKQIAKTKVLKIANN